MRRCCRVSAVACGKGTAVLNGAGVMCVGPVCLLRLWGPPLAVIQARYCNCNGDTCGTLCFTCVTGVARHEVTGIKSSHERRSRRC